MQGGIYRHSASLPAFGDYADAVALKRDLIERDPRKSVMRRKEKGEICITLIMGISDQRDSK